jgi:hypothetical protein
MLGRWINSTSLASSVPLSSLPARLSDFLDFDRRRVGSSGTTTTFLPDGNGGLKK